MSRILTAQVYRHYKGNHYRILAVAKHSETLEVHVVYEALYDNPEGKIWVRPLAMFQENVVIKGQSIPRFLLASESQTEGHNDY